MSTYYTKEQLENMSEAERTALYNSSTGKSVSRMRNKAKAVDAILAHQAGATTDDSPMEDVPPPATDDKGKKKSIKQQVRDILVHEFRGASDVVNAVAYTVAEICTKTGGTESSVRTALSDLKSDKYAGAGGKLNIVKAKNAEGEPAFCIHS